MAVPCRNHRVDRRWPQRLPNVHRACRPSNAFRRSRAPALLVSERYRRCRTRNGRESFATAANWAICSRSFPIFRDRPGLTSEHVTSCPSFDRWRA